MSFFEFFKRQITIARVYSIPVRADYRWFFVLGLMSLVTANNIGSLDSNFPVDLAFGAAMTCIFFVSIFLHEFAHAVVARAENVPVAEIILHPFGGLTRLRREPDTPRAEFRIAVAGPVASFLLAVVFVVLTVAFSSLGANSFALVFKSLALLNFLLAVFNLFPGYPLDGGRVLRAYLWRRGRDLNEATILTGRFGQLIGGILAAFGIFAAVARGDVFTGFWTALAGAFLFDAARSIIRQTRRSEKIAVGDVMSLPVAVAPEASVLHFVDNVLPLCREKVFPVARDRQLYGILALEDLKKLPRERWRETKISSVMRPVTPDYFVETGAVLSQAKQLMRINGVAALGVIDAAGNLVGFLYGKNKN